MNPPDDALLNHNVRGFVQILQFFKKAWNLPSNFPDLEEVWKVETKSGKMVNSLEFFSKLQEVLFSEVFVLFWSIWFNLARTLGLHREKPLFLRFLRSAYIDHLLDNLESGERSYCFRKKSGRSLEFGSIEACSNPRNNEKNHQSTLNNLDSGCISCCQVAPLKEGKKFKKTFKVHDVPCVASVSDRVIARKLEQEKKKVEGGGGWGEEETLARKPHDSGKRPLIFHHSVHL